MIEIDQIIAALQGRPDMASELRARLAETAICGPWLPLPPQRDGDHPQIYFRRNVDRFIDIIAHVAEYNALAGLWKYLITSGDIGRTPGKDNSWVEGFMSAESAMAAADRVLTESRKAILATPLRGPW